MARLMPRPWTPITAAALAVGGTAAAQDLITPDRIGLEGAETTITMQPRFAYSHQSNDEARQATLTEAFRAWILRHPDVQINVEVQQGDDNVIVARRLQDAEAGRAGDVVMTEDLNYQQFYALTESFSPYLTDEQREDFLPGILEGMTDPESGEVKYLQMTAYTFGLWYRSDLVDAPPSSLEELAEMAATLAEENDFRYGLFTLGGNEVMRLTLLSHMASLDAQIMADDAQSTPVFGEDGNRQPLIDVLTWYKDQVDSGVMPSEVVSFSSSGDVYSRVTAGEMPFVLGGSYMAGGISRTPDGDKWSFAPMPQLGGADPVSFQGGWSWAMFNDDPAEQALITDLLLDTYIGPWPMANWAIAGGYTPTRRSVLENHAYFTNDPLAQTLVEVISEARPLPNGEYYSLTADSMANAFQSVMLGALSPEEAVDEAWEEIQLDID